MYQYERKECFPCPVCWENIYFDVENIPEKVRCEHCKSEVEISQQKRVEAQVFRAFSQQFVNR